MNTQGFVWKFFYALYINFHSFIHTENRTGAYRESDRGLQRIGQGPTANRTGACSESDRGLQGTRQEPTGNKEPTGNQTGAYGESDRSLRGQEPIVNQTGA